MTLINIKQKMQNLLFLAEKQIVDNDPAGRSLVTIEIEDGLPPAITEARVALKFMEVA